jgi:hypothetical protein
MNSKPRAPTVMAALRVLTALHDFAMDLRSERISYMDPRPASARQEPS